jgi:hypothetical protein
MNNQFRREHGKPLQQKNQSEIALRVMNWAFWLGTLALILISVTSCNEVKLAVNTDIESPLRNTCQSGDLDPTFPKCQDEGSPTFTSAIPSMLSPSPASAEEPSFPTDPRIARLPRSDTIQHQ